MIYYDGPSCFTKNKTILNRPHTNDPGSIPVVCAGPACGGGFLSYIQKVTYGTAGSGRTCKRDEDPTAHQDVFSVSEERSYASEERSYVSEGRS